jgi:tetratricopeptide (TPR) repeat protein
MTVRMDALLKNDPLPREVQMPSPEPSVMNPPPSSPPATFQGELVEPFASALHQGKGREAADAPATSPEALFSRAILRASIGRDEDARRDLAAATPSLADWCVIETGLLDLRRVQAASVRTTAEQIIARAPQSSPLRARAMHVLGLALGRLGNSAAAIDALLGAGEGYEVLGNRAKHAEVYDSLGMLHAARGRIDYAMSFFALSLADKSLSGDRAGMAITLGNMGRAHLREGRYSDALICFGRDAELSRSIGDLRGEAKTLQDIGRTHAAAGNLAAAETPLLQSLDRAKEEGAVDLVFFALRELAMLRIAQGRLDEAETQLNAAEASLPAGADDSLRLMMDVTRGQLLAARGDPRATETLENAVNRLASTDLLDLEIPARLALARTLLRDKSTATAEACLHDGITRARQYGSNRDVKQLEEMMTQFDLVEGAISEKYRPLHQGTSPPADDYIARQRLGAGTYGEVFRAFDPLRDRDVALKRIHLCRLYETQQRERLIASARIELAAASRVRHPGVVRVWAIGTEPQGDFYVVQDYIPGNSLRHNITVRETPLCEILVCVANIADALAALHAHDVVHRDVKPDNVIVREDGSPVLVDFGVAHVLHLDLLGEDVLVGTLEYLAPEQARAGNIDGRADLYSLGVMTYEWLAGCRPLRLRGENIDAKIDDLQRRSPPPLTDFRPDLAGPVNELVMRLLEKRPHRRPASAQDVAEVCRKLAVQEGTREN